MSTMYEDEHADPCIEANCCAMCEHPEVMLDCLKEAYGYNFVCADKSSTFSGAFIIGGEYVYIKQVLYNNPVTIVFWSDGTKTVSKCAPADFYSRETGLAICVLKKLVGGVAVKKILSQWVDDSDRVTLKEIRAKEKSAGRA